MGIDAGSISAAVRIRLSELSGDITACKTAVDNLGAEFVNKAEKYSTLAGQRYVNSLKTISKEIGNVESAQKAGALTEEQAISRLIQLRQTELKILQDKAVKEGTASTETVAAINKTQAALGLLVEKEALLAKAGVGVGAQLMEIDSMLGGFGQKILGLMANPFVLATAAIIGTIKAFTDITKSLVEYGSKIQETSEKTGLSTKALQEYKYIAEQTGGSLDTITASIKMMARGLETNADTFAKIGVSIKDANGSFRSTTDIFNDTIGALGNLSNDTERTNLALKLFGRGALDMVPLLKEGSKGIEELRDKAHSLGLIMSDETIKNAHDFEKSTDSLKASWKSFSMSLVQDALPALKLVTDSYLYATQLINTARVAAENNKVIEAYQKGKASVIEYHDAIESMIAINQAAADDDRNSAAVKTKALSEISYGYHELNKIARDYGTARAEQEKKEQEIAKSNAAVQALKDEEDRLNALRAARDAATKEYNDSILKTQQLETANLRSDQDAQKEKIDATRKYAEALVPIVAASGSAKIGAEALANAEKALGLTFEDSRTWYADITQGAIEHIAALSKTTNTVGEVTHSLKELLGSEGNAYSSDVVAKVNEIINAMQKENVTVKQQKELWNTLEDSIKSTINGIADLYSNIVKGEIDTLTERYDLEKELIENNGKTKEQTLQDNLATAIAANDAKAIDDAQKALDLFELEKKYNKEKAQLQYQADMAAWEAKMVTAAADAAMAIIKCFADLCPFGWIAAAAVGVATGVQEAAIAAAKPKAPSAATGGIVLPSPGGTLVNTAENNHAELLLNDSAQGGAMLEAFASKIVAAMGGAQGGTIVVQSILDGKVIAESTVRRIDNGEVRMKT
jgi:hypothetical protein